MPEFPSPHPPSDLSQVEPPSQWRLHNSCSFGPFSPLKIPGDISKHVEVVERSRGPLAYLNAIALSGMVELENDRHADLRLIIKPPFFSVVRGQPAIKSVDDQRSQALTGYSGIQLAIEIVLQAIVTSSAQRSVDDVLTKANESLAQMHQKIGIDNSEAGYLNGVTGVLVKVEKDFIHIAQWGDCLWALISKDHIGMAGVNQSFCDDAALRKYVKERANGQLTREEYFRKIHNHAWESRNRRANQRGEGGYGYLCGQPSFFDCYTTNTFPTEALKKLVVYSLGLVPIEHTVDPERLLQEDFLPHSELHGARFLHAILANTADAQRGSNRTARTPRCAALLLEYAEL